MGTLIEIGLWNAAASAVLALLAAAVARLCRRPALTHTLWLLVLLKLVTPPLIPFSLSWPAAESPSQPAVGEPTVADAEPAESDPSEPDPILEEPEGAGAGLPEPLPAAPAAPPIPWHWWAGLAWLAGSALWAGWVALHVVRFQRALRHARPAPASLRDEAECLARRLGLRRCPDVWLVPGAVSPMVWALGRCPRLLFPSGLLDRLDAEGRAALLAHELAHLRRRDHWVRLLELAATGLYWWLPVLWWARRELHEAEEQCCDAWGVWALDGDGRPYALALLQAVAFVSQARFPLPVGASGGVGQLSHLKRRLEMVMQGKTSRSLSWAGLVAVGGLGLLLPLFPALGQAQVPARPAAEPAAADTAKDQRDREIEALKRAIQLLEAQKERDWKAENVKAGRLQRESEKDATLEKQLQEVEMTIQVKKKELGDLESMAEMLRAKLKEQSGRPGFPGNFTNKFPATKPPVKTPEGRVDDLEKKLDGLQKELEELRRSLLRKSATDPTGPSRVPGNGNTPAPLPRTTPDDPTRIGDPATKPGTSALPADPSGTPPVTGTSPRR
jgi:beta-lactamase regulating signal transducer with metallopeptidase domain